MACKKCKCKKPIQPEITAVHDINTFSCSIDNELYLGGINEYGEHVTIVCNTIEILEWLDI